ncbi:MAG: ABC transporter substrate-binding protein, partial [Intrasporangiaceae bacterium]|nr:ABC transporter substrate-binding protein [Intrasporangiaceae bacterium]
MRKMTAWRRSAALVCAVAMIAVACGGGDEEAEEPDAAEEPADDGGDDAADDAAEDEGDDADDDAAPTEIATDVGVTDEACPEGVNPDNGCIYLGHISDLTEGPFFPLAVEILAAQENFFERVNEDGGVAGYDVSLVTRDNKYNPQEHVTVYEEIADDVLSLGMSLGTPPTLAALDLMEEDQMLAVPASWWSGWDHDASDRGLVMASGYSYCIESMIGLDWYAGEFGDPETVLAVGYPGDYGGDSA